MPHYVLINGAPRSGKDTIAMHLWLHNPGMMFERFSMPNKRAFAGTMNALMDMFGNVEPYESTKEEIISVLGVSYRQWQIDYSEKFMKPLYGKDIMGRLLRKRTIDHHAPIVIPDCGFQAEVEMLADHPALLITVKREGCSFANDSREYVTPAKGWSHVTIHNDKSLKSLHDAADRVYDSWIAQCDLGNRATPLFSRPSDPGL